MGIVETQGGGRRTYHHGDLPHALATAGTQLARKGGPEAVVLREAARQVGVSATAAYRHFANHLDLIHAVKEQAQAMLTEYMREEVAGVEPSDDPAEAALRRLRALGAGYVHFALAEPGLFRTAFCRTDKPDAPRFDILTAQAYQLLSATVEGLAEQGLIGPQARPFAEMTAWSSMHGLAMLFLEGPLRWLGPEEREAALHGVIDAVLAGICRPAG
jgi:AcrR family transcriptional regulator